MGLKLWNRRELNLTLKPATSNILRQRENRVHRIFHLVKLINY